ncbi:NHLP bacteriocin export ABC transporter permease/ATPase subunit [Scytonema tolypothrichoides VB-61278]|nr:NHLP bacteriocin export ABC transporter permease/ATPase subunit [Scytonema tolypothrichoides VB-61278]
MLNQTKLKTPQEQQYLFKGNEPILLDDPQTIWIVKSGSIALFAIKVKHGITEGSRRYLFSVGASEAMFSTAPSSQDEVHQILAVSMEETELIRVSKEDFSKWIVNDDGAQCPPLWGHGKALTYIENWIHQLSSVLSNITAPKLPVKPEGINYFALGNGDIFQPQQDTVSWVQIQQGTAKWMGFEELLFFRSSGILPLDTRMWLQATDTVELSCVNTSAIKDADILTDSLNLLQTYFLDCVELLEQQEITAELRRFQERERLNYQVMEETLQELSSVLQPRKTVYYPTVTPTDDPDQALLTAAGAVGRALGLKICPPAKSEDIRRVQDPLEAIARASRIRMRQITLTDKWWKKDTDPMLTYTVADNHPVALLPVSDARYEIFDPVEHTRIPVNARSASKLAPHAYVFYRPLPDKKLKTLDMLKFALRGHFRELIVILLTGIATTVLGMLTPTATAILIDNAIPDAKRELLLQIAFGLLAAAFGEAIFQLTQAFAIIRLETFADSSIQAAVWDRLLNLKASFFRSYSIGDLNSRVNGITQMREKLSGTVLKTIFSSFFSLLNLGLLFYYNTSLAMIACVVAVVNIAVTIVSGILTLHKVRPLLEIEGQLSGVMVQLINGVAKLRVAGCEARAFAYWGKQYSHQLKLMLSTQGIEDIVTVINKILPPLTNAVLFWFAVQALHGTSLQQPNGGGLSTGTFLAFNAAFGIFINGATSLSNTIVEVLEVLPLWNRLQPILLATPELNSSKTDPGRLSGRVVVDHAIFRYRNDGPLTLDDVTIRAEPGEFIAIVGPSGSGKSTLFRLLLGFDFPESGTIYYDGQDLAGLDVNAVRRQLGVVMQNSRMMSGSFFENIASGALVTMEEAWEAAQAAGLADDIQAMPMGMHTVISEGGTNLSGGQRQRLLIARALVLKPRILLFDEATSALDNKTQAIVSQSLERLQVTRIAIAHRFSTIRHANRIYVLQDGRVVQQGNFEQLASQQGLFAQLMARQML